jgi:hypothetical protein
LLGRKAIILVWFHLVKLLNNTVCTIWGWDWVVSVATSCGMDVSALEPRWGQEILCFWHPSRPLASCTVGTGVKVAAAWHRSLTPIGAEVHKFHTLYLQYLFRPLLRLFFFISYSNPFVPNHG